MKLFIYPLMVVLFIGNAAGQTPFDKGYYTDNNGNKTECLIRSHAWRTIPVQFNFRMSEKDTVITLTVYDVSEFAVYGGNRFISKKILIDASSDDLTAPSNQQEPEWKEVRIFLSVLVEGKASLYKYNAPDMTRFFYSIDGGPVQQLIYKRFKPDPDKEMISYNVAYRQQLWKDLQYSGADITKFDRLSYDEKSLVEFFKEYNQSSGSTSQVYHRRPDKGAFHFKITPGISFSSLQVMNLNMDKNFIFTFPVKPTMRLGAEVELVFPYTCKKAAFLIEPVYRSFSDKASNGAQEVEADFHIIEIPVGFRYYFYLNKKMSVFGDVLAIMPWMVFNPKSSIYYTGKTSESFSENGGWAFGAGMKYRMFSAELRYNTIRKIFSGSSMVSQYTNLEIVLGFRIF